MVYINKQQKKLDLVKQKYYSIITTQKINQNKKTIAEDTIAKEPEIYEEASQSSEWNKTMEKKNYCT